MPNQEQQAMIREAKRLATEVLTQIKKACPEYPIEISEAGIRVWGGTIGKREITPDEVIAGFTEAVRLYATLEDEQRNAFLAICCEGETDGEIIKIIELSPTKVAFWERSSSNETCIH
ncbi:MAG: hypothetical protein WBP69_19995 [Terriglobales bacterium]